MLPASGPEAWDLMARKPSARVVLNRSRMARVHLGLADGVGAVAAEIIEVANPPDATPYGVGLVQGGGWLLYKGDKKLAGAGLDGRQPKKPRSLRVRGTTLIVAIAGFGFPGRFQELGTVQAGAQPFLVPAERLVIPGKVDYLMRRHLAPFLP